MDRPDLAHRLNLEPHPEGGWYRRVYTSPQSVEPGDGRGTRPTATAVQYLLMPGESSSWHTVGSDELWLWQHGGALTLTSGGSGTTPASPSSDRLLGPDVEHGHLLHALVPAGTWQCAAPADGRPVLVTCVVTPGFDFADFALLPG